MAMLSKAVLSAYKELFYAISVIVFDNNYIQITLASIQVQIYFVICRIYTKNSLKRFMFMS